VKCSAADVHVEPSELPGVFVAICRHDVVSQGVGEDRAREAILEACEMVDDHCVENNLPNPLVFVDEPPRFPRD
jgi:hypothetical protein